MDSSEVLSLASSLIEYHGLEGWSCRLNRNKRRLGVCRESERLIELSEPYVAGNSREHVVDTILHEIAHALVGTQHGHNHIWKAKCLDLGCSPRACDRSAKMPDGRWQAVCPSCRNLFHRHRKPRKVKGHYCAACGPDSGRLYFKDATSLPQRPVRSGMLERPLQLLLKLF